MNPDDKSKDPKLAIHLGDEQFPFHLPDKTISIQSIALISAVDPKAAPLTLNVSVGTKKAIAYTLQTQSGPGDLRIQEKPFQADLGDIVISGSPTDVAKIKELSILFRYEVVAKTGP